MRRKEEKTGKAVLIYDGNCPVCKKTVEWIKKKEYKASFEMLPCQSEEMRRRFPFIEPAVCMQAMQLILPDGHVLSGEKAFPEILKRLKRYCHAAELFKLPASEIIAGYFYRLLADNRYHIASVLFPEKTSEKELERK
jgi:predicted DCC family thiol-disulfide oxidoreductase YuxK